MIRADLLSRAHTVTTSTIRLQYESNITTTRTLQFLMTSMTQARTRVVQVRRHYSLRGLYTTNTSLQQGINERV